MSTDLADRVSDLDLENTMVIIQLLDNSVFEFLLKMVIVFFQTGNDRKFHAESKLKVIVKDSLREVFMKMQPVFKTVKGFRGIVLSPL